MNLDQTKHFRMYENVQLTLDDNTVIWNGVPVIVKTKNNFDELIQRIQYLNEKAGNSSTSVAITKDNLRKSLVNKITLLAGKLFVLGEITGDEELKAMGDISRGELHKARETDMDALIRPVIKKCMERINDLTDYGLTDNQVTEATTTLDSFNALIGQPRNILNKVYAAKNQMDELIDESMDLLNNRLDKLMLMFQHTHPGFYEQYQRARVIVD
ncbi:MAG: hypothetical protein JXB49_18940 [Bacteroidales bacterium]|nr:hypothetical protein [Bacteroidales bacterium]